MTNGHIVNSLHLDSETIAVPHSGIPIGSGLVVPTRVLLEGAYPPAQLAFARAAQTYAERLAVESANQEASERAPGASNREITESAVIRAQEALDKKVALQLRKRSPLEPYALVGGPVFSGAAGVMGGFFHSPLQVIVFGVFATIAITCIVLLARKGLTA